MPIMPTLTPRWNRRAASPLDVKIAVPFPYGLALINAIARSTVSACSTDSTGPKISSRYTSISGVTWSIRVGPTKKPFSYPGTVSPRPSTVSSAPCASPEAIRPSMRSLAAWVTTGPISLAGSRPGPTLVARAISRSRSISGPDSPTATAAEIAMQRSPADPYAAAVRCPAANSRSASGSTIAWFLAPPNACTRLPCSVPRWWMYRAIGVDPTNETAATSGWSSSASTATLSPLTTLNTPSGRPASAHSSATSWDADGSRSLGLSTNALPQAIATGCIHIGTITGKLNGVMPATTPSGWRNEYTSTLVETWSEKEPLSSCGMPQANSTTSRPRCTSPRASETTLPCSSEMTSARSFTRALTSSRKANMILVRLDRDACDHSSNAAFAVRTASSTSAVEASATCACCAPVAGLNTGPKRSADERRLAGPAQVPAHEPVVGFPPIQWFIVRTLVRPSTGTAAGWPCWRRRSCGPAGWSRAGTPRCRSASCALRGRQARVDRLPGPGTADPGVCRVVADQPGPLGARTGHHVEVVQVVARYRHRRPVPAVRDQHHVAAAHFGAHVDRPVRGAVHPLVGHPVRAADLEVVDLLEDRLARAVLVVLVRRVRRPVAARRDDLAGDDAVGVERLQRGEVVDLPGCAAGAAQLDRYRSGGQVLCGEPARRPRCAQGEPAAGCAADRDVAPDRRVHQVGRSGEDTRPAGQLVPLAVGLDRAAAFQRQHDDLVLAGGVPVRTAGRQRQHAQPGVRPPA